MPKRSPESSSPNSVQSPLAMYLREINETPLLSEDTEKELAARVERGDMEARDQMIRANLRLVVSVARGFTGKGLSLQDLIAEGNLGLMRAVQGFDPAFNTRFSTYASYWIKQAIKRALINTAKTIRLPAYMVEFLAKWRRGRERLKELLDRVPTEEEIIRALDFPPNKLSIIKKGLFLQGAQQTSSETKDGLMLGETLPANGESGERALEDEEYVQRIMSSLGTLDERDQRVLRMRFGLDNEGQLTLKEIGEIFNISRERVRQIESASIGKLQKDLGNDVLELKTEISLDELLGELDGNKKTVEDLLALTRSELLRRIDILPIHYQDVLLYRLGFATRGMYLPHKEIARKMNIPESKVKTFEERALEKLKAHTNGTTH